MAADPLGGDWMADLPSNPSVPAGPLTTPAFLSAPAYTAPARPQAFGGLSRNAAASGSNWYVVAGIVLAAMWFLGLLLTLLLPPLGLSLLGMLSLVGMALSIIGGIRMLVVAFQEDVSQGLMYLFVPFYSLYYLISRWSEMWRPFALSLAGAGMAILCSLGMLGAGFVSGLLGEARGRSAEAAQRADWEEIRAPGGGSVTGSPNPARTVPAHPDSEELRTAAWEIASLRGRMPDRQSVVERHLQSLPGYVAGSLQIDEARRRVMLQYRGPERTAGQYQMIVELQGRLELAGEPSFR